MTNAYSLEYSLEWFQSNGGKKSMVRNTKLATKIPQSCFWDLQLAASTEMVQGVFWERSEDGVCDQKT